MKHVIEGLPENLPPGSYYVQKVSQTAEELRVRYLDPQPDEVVLGDFAEDSTVTVTANREEMTKAANLLRSFDREWEKTHGEEKPVQNLRKPYNKSQSSAGWVKASELYKRIPELNKLFPRYDGDISEDETTTNRRAAQQESYWLSKLAKGASGDKIKRGAARGTRWNVSLVRRAAKAELLKRKAKADKLSASSAR